MTKIMVYIFLRDYFEIFERYILNLYYICLILFRVNFWQNVTFDMLKMYREEKPLVPLSLNLKAISFFFRRAEEWQAYREQGGKRGGERKSVIVAHSPTILCIPCIPVGALTHSQGGNLLSFLSASNLINNFFFIKIPIFIS
jgi:hypothetical protein